MSKITDLISSKFQSQKSSQSVLSTCPHCGKKIDFEFEHTQNTEVTTKLVKLEKGE